MNLKNAFNKLTRAEEEIMQIIWRIEPCLVRDIMEQLGDLTIPHSTISSVVRILEKKQFVGHKSYGKTHEYFSLVSQQEYTQLETSTLLTRYFNGSAKSLVSFLVQENQIELKELSDLMKKLENSNNENN